MASVKLEHIYKVYTGGTKAVTDMTLEMKDGEFIVLVGPSGCGKSTTLRMIAGLEEISAGELYIGDQIVNDMEPKDRDIAMVFQNYALYPQMTVYENMAFGLKLRHVPNDVIQQKVMWAADILGLTELLDRKPRAMSGGQRQRVALGRAILRDPKVMLLDEPLSNLDAKLRASMRTEIAKLHKRLKTTFVYVTHDQTEAMTLGDRVVVIKKGIVQQFDSPKNLYDYPANLFVAGFIGTPQMNFYDGYLTKDGDIVHVSFDKTPEVLDVPFANLIKVNPAYLDGKHHVTIGVRCEHVHIVPNDTPNSLTVKVNHFEELGAETLVYGDIGTGAEQITDSSTAIIIRLNTMPEDIDTDSVIHVTFDSDFMYFFDHDTEDTIVPRIPTINAFDCSIKDGKLTFLGNTIDMPSALAANSCEKGTLLVPNDGFTIGNGPVTATVVRTEDVNGQLQLHLQIGNRVFFTLIDKAYEPGTQVQLGLDWSRIRVFTDAGEDGSTTDVIKPIPAFDDFHANFLNHKTVMAKGDFPEFAKNLEDAKARVAKEYDEKAAALEAEYQKTRNAAVPSELRAIDDRINQGDKEAKADRKAYIEKVSAPINEELNTKIIELQSQIGDVRAKKAQDIATLKANHKQNIANIKSKNKQLYADLKAKEIADYKKFCETNKDKDALKRRKEEYHVFKDSFTDQKRNALEQDLKGEDLVFDNAISKTKATAKREISNLKKAIKDAKAEASRKIDPASYLEKKHQEDVKELQQARAAAEEKATLLFYFGIGTYYFPVNSVISGKLIQGLGTRVFTKNYLLEVPHGAYKFSQEGVPATVVGVADYGDKKFAECQYFDSNGNQLQAYVLTDEIPAEGSKVNLTFDLTKCQITETGMGIRLY